MCFISRCKQQLGNYCSNAKKLGFLEHLVLQGANFFFSQILKIWVVITALEQNDNTSISVYNILLEKDSVSRKMKSGKMNI